MQGDSYGVIVFVLRFILLLTIKSLEYLAKLNVSYANIISGQMVTQKLEGDKPKCKSGGTLEAN